MNVTELLAPWEAINAALGLSAPVRDEAHYTELLAFVDECFERFGAVDQHPVFALVDLVAVRIKEYEDRAHPWPDASTPASRLAFLMEQHGLRRAHTSYRTLPFWTGLFHGEPATRAGNPGFAQGSKPVPELYTAARAVEWPIRFRHHGQR